ncbi:UPF0764 protein C16orf89, partial [Plecturocebus cupreus]
MGFHHIGQAGLKLLTPGDPPISASQRYHFVTHAGVQQFDLGSLQPLPPGFSSITSSWDYRLMPPHQAFLFDFFCRWGFSLLARLVSELLTSNDPPFLAAKSAWIT